MMINIAMKHLVNCLERMTYEKHDVETDILFINPPFWSIQHTPLAFPALKNELLKDNRHVTYIDLSILMTRQLFDEHWLFFRDYCRMGKLDFLSNKESLKLIHESENIYDLLKLELNIDQKTYLDWTMNLLIEYYNKGLPILDKMNLLIRTIKNYDLIRGFRSGSKVLSLSISYESQFFFSFIIAKLFKTIHKETKIIIGGAFFKYTFNVEDEYYSKIKYFNELLEQVDGISYGDGEESLRFYCQSVIDNLDIDKVPNIYHKENDKFIKTFSKKYDFNTESTIPNFDDVNFEYYFNYEKFLLYRFSTECYWGMCHFCDDGKKNIGWRKKSTLTIIKELEELTLKYNIYNFNFVDEAIEPKQFIEFVEILSEHPMSEKIRWFVFMKHSPLLTTEVAKKAFGAGCRMIMFGTETFNDRILKKIKKSTNQKIIRQNIKDFSDNNIAVLSYLITGFPTQTPEEIYEDIEMLKELVNVNKNYKFGYIQKLHAYPGTYIAEHKDEYNITRLNDQDYSDFDSLDIHGNEIDNGLREEAIELYKKTLTELKFPQIDRSFCFIHHKNEIDLDDYWLLDN